MFVREFIVSGIALCRSRSSRIARIEVPGNKFLSTGMGDLTHEVVITAVGRPHESGLDANDALEGSLNTTHLGMYFLGRERGEVFVGPCV